MKIKTFLFVATLAMPSAALAQSTSTDSTRKPAPTAPSTSDQAQGEKSADKAADNTKTTTTDKNTDPSKTTNRGEKTAKLSKDETKIVAHYHHVNGMEISMGKLAQQKGTAPVKRYGEQLQQDHKAADKELTTFAKRRGLAKIPADKPATEVERQEHKLQMQEMAALKKLKGADFDREFLRQMVDAHEKELAKTDVAMASATDAELKTMLETTKAMLQRHADTARELQKGTAQASAAPAPSTGTPPASNAPAGAPKTSAPATPGPKTSK